MTGFRALPVQRSSAAAAVPQRSRPAPRGAAPAVSHIGPSIQAKLRIGAVDDPLEREADRVADAVTSDHNTIPMSDGGAPAVRRMCAECEAEDEPTLRRQEDARAPEDEEETLQRKCADCEQEDTLQRQQDERAPEDDEEPVQLKRNGDAATPGAAQTAAAALTQGGAPLSRSVRSYFEPRFGRDFPMCACIHTIWPRRPPTQLMRVPIPWGTTSDSARGGLRQGRTRDGGCLLMS